MKLHYEIMIEASPEEVWDAIVDDAKYRQWTRVFQEGSYFEGGWEKGDKIRFLSTNAKGEKEGMIAEIAESQKNRFLSIRHLGMVLGGKEDTVSEAAKNWVPAYENYTLTPQEGGTCFEVDLDSSDDEMNEMFKDTWPRALEKLKQVAEKRVIAA
ncbi:MAG: SRPBCC domain-containing protein [Candidatus Bathyarchaeota archaeon]|nr:SRPBCC domain-containing protein [Candidatus Bathyarchaeota archaeon]